LESAWKKVFISWQMLLIAVAVILLLHRHIFKGLILVSIGGFYIVPRLAAASPDAFWWVKEDFTHAYSPVFLIVAGGLILLHIVFHPKRLLKKHQQKNHHHSATKTQNHHQKKSTTQTDFEQKYAVESVKTEEEKPHHQKKNKAQQVDSEQNIIVENVKKEKKENHEQNRNTAHANFERNSIFKSISEIIHELEFEGGEMNAVFGNITLDLRKTTIPDNVCELNINVIFGGITILVPENWNVEVHLNSIFGNLQDSRALSEKTDKTHTLIIHGICVFGNGEIKS
jgi:predicted membrane protein